ncbi:MAG: DALR anticodon-binding domain-containing protein [Bacillota bacterium]
MVEEILKKHLQACVYAKYDIQISFDMVEVYQPKNHGHGDFTSNIAMKAAKRLNEKPEVLASYLKEAMTAQWHMIQEIEVKSPGFLNFFLSEQWMDICLDELQQRLPEIHRRLQKFMMKLDDDVKKNVIESLSREDIKKTQYVHSRMHSILNIFHDEGRFPRQIGDPIPDRHRTEEEKVVIQKIIMYPEVIKVLEEKRDCHEFLLYLREIAEAFQKFSGPLLLRQMPFSQLAFILQMMDIIREIVKNGLTAFGLAAPEKM